MRVLLIEDDKSLALAVAYHLKKEGYDFEHRENGRIGLAAIEESDWDLLILDRMMPEMSGDELMKILRDQDVHIPTLMLTALGGVSDRVEGLDLGADDYLVKPFAMDELLARVRALLRRPRQWTPPDALKSFDLSLDRERMALSCKEKLRRLSPRESELMAFLMTNRDQVLPRGVILDRVWRESFVEDGNLDIYIHFLRKHIRALKSSARIETVRGVGYQLTSD